MQNYGTKWDVNEVNFQDTESLDMKISFDTAWGPPDNWFRKLIETFPNTEMKLKFAEPGCNFMGYISNQDECSYDYEEVCQECGTVSKWVENEENDGMYCSECDSYDVDTEASIFID
jgi:hypothetical protein